MRIYLFGMPLAGKTTLGKKLAENLKFSFLDIDEIIEQKEGKDISFIVNEFSIEYFRKLETNELRKIHDSNLDNVVVSCGGGIIEEEVNHSLMDGIKIYIEVDISNLKQRRKGDIHPLLKTYSLEELFAIRKSLYEELSDIKVTNNETETDALQKIKESLKYLL